MRKTTRTTIATMIMLACASYANAADKRVDNLTFFSGTKAVSAEQVLHDNAERFGLPADLKNLVLTRVTESLTGKHYYYQQMLRGLPVDRAEIVVSIGKDGSLQKIFNETLSISGKDDADAVNQLYNKQQISDDQALDKGWNNMKVQHKLVSVPTTTLVWVRAKDGVQLARKVRIEAEMPTGGFVQFLNAHDGTLIDSYSTSLPRTNKSGERSISARGKLDGATLDRASATADAKIRGKSDAGAPKAAANQAAAVQAAASGINGSGYVFDPDPRTVLNTDALTDTSAASAFDAAYSTKSLNDLTVTSGVYKLSGPYVNIKDIEAPNTAPSTTTNGVWTAKRGNDAFDDTNVYFHLDQNQRYIQSLGFTGTKSIINRPLDVDTNGVNGDDNSHYSGGSPGSDYLAFGHGCVNDSEDADVILHEYGHGIQANIDSSWSGGDTGAMGEGFGDYWAASYSYSTPNGKTYHPEWAFSWDGHGSCWAGRMLNRSDAKYNASKTYAAHTSVTENGVTFQSDELWSAPLYLAMVDLIAAGKPRANIDKIILEAHFGLGANVKMPAMATAIVNAAKNLFPGDLSYANTYQAKFEAQKILTATGPTMSETESNNTIATANLISTANTTVNATMSASTDVDYFKVTLPAGKTLTVAMTPNSSSDYDLELYNSAGTKLSSSVNGKGAVDTVSKANTGSSSMDLYAKVIYYSGGTGATSGKYTLNASW
ncbi:pre-peptidase C-terminal domain-containing protein [Pseudoduganella sp. RAF19]|uniref:pre-peptidase C-terminal domain-containing protein n=1 Tax=Pseudoduganella sp. RAF19 TaxID=3233052 RepID=UPI003F9EA4CF